MTDLATQCPHCSTRFHLESAQLEAARGIVRCGNCRALFLAVQPGPAAELPSAAAQPAASEPAVEALDVSAPPPLAADETPVEPPMSPWTYRGVDLDELDLGQHQSAPAEPLPGTPSIEPLHAPLGAAVHPDEPVASAVPFGPALREAELRLSPVTDDNPAPPSPLTADTRTIRGEMARQRSDARIEPALGRVDLPTDAAHALPDRAFAIPRQPAKGDESLFDVDDEPLDLAPPRRRKSWGRRIVWSLLILLALLALAGQYVYFNLDQLARQEPYRPWLERICPLAGCTLPSRVDIEQIRSSNLVVRSHPEFNGALVVDAIIYNRAPFAQPFPLLEFNFADIDGKVVASRSFKPGEYLSGELTGQQQMPSQVPIHISLDILDPGTRAVNYSLGFRSPD
jgi:predicted Zn finger-like uncharacterized protein